MTPKEEAEQLVSKFMANIIFSIEQNIHASTVEAAKNCALISVNEILELDVVWYDLQLIKDYPETYKPNQTFKYWEEVKQEIEKL